MSDGPERSRIVFRRRACRFIPMEELCYYLSSHMICYLYTLPEEDLLVYIRDELGLEKLYRQLSRLTDPDRDQMKYFSALFGRDITFPKTKSGRFWMNTGI